MFRNVYEIRQFNYKDVFRFEIYMAWGPPSKHIPSIKSSIVQCKNSAAVVTEADQQTPDKNVIYISNIFEFFERVLQSSC